METPRALDMPKRTDSDKQAPIPAWMEKAKRLEAEHCEQAAQQMREDHLSSPDCSEWYQERDRKDGMRYWRSRQASACNLYRKRPQMDDVREGMTDSERLAYDKGVAMVKQATKPKTTWRERLAKLPPERQEVVKKAILETLKRKRLH